MPITVGSAKWFQMRSEVYIRDKGICWICNLFVDLKDYELGHLVDRFMDGTNEYDNVAVMHKRCNCSKPLHKTLRDVTKWRLTLNNTLHSSQPSQPTTNHKIIKAKQIINKTPYGKIVFSVSDLAKSPLLK